MNSIKYIFCIYVLPDGTFSEFLFFLLVKGRGGGKKIVKIKTL